MDNSNELYSLWCAKATEDADVAAELKEINGDADAIHDRFCRYLSFGTGGLRGVLGAGTNRMNIYTVAHATQGLACYLLNDYADPSVVIGYDSRNKSEDFAKKAACVLAANGIKVRLFRELIPTPVVAWAVRRLSCASGIVITASHNPSEYNGYKCYDARGYQMTDEAADKTLAFIGKTDLFEDVKNIDFDTALAQGMISLIEPAFLDTYYREVLTRQIHPGVCADSDLNLIYTPLNGTGNKPVRRILSEIGLKNVTVVPAQEMPDGRFPTCPFPNPEIRQAFEEALKLTEQDKADLLLATDPDCDRVGIAVRHHDAYVLLTGNEVGCMLAEYILSSKKEAGTLAEEPVLITTIVSTMLAEKIGAYYGAKTYSLLTGFKYIGEMMTQLEENGEADRFELGFEESYGYLTGMHTRDKDAVNASMLIAEMAAYYKKKGMTLVDFIESIYEKYGYYLNSLFNYYVKGADGMERMNAMLDVLRTKTPEQLGGVPVTRFTDYQQQIDRDCVTGKTEKTVLPVSNVIVLMLGDRDRLIVRPSGTEPKLKIYISAASEDKKEAEKATELYRIDAEKLLGL